MVDAAGQGRHLCWSPLWESAGTDLRVGTVFPPYTWFRPARSVHPLCTLCRAPLLCVHLIVRVHGPTCSRMLLHIVPPWTHTRPLHPPPAVTVIAHLLHSVRIKTTKPLFRCTSDIRENLGKCTATLKSRFFRVISDCVLNRICPSWFISHSKHIIVSSL